VIAPQIIRFPAVAGSYLKMEKLGPICVFSPAVLRASVVARAVEDFVAIVPDNSVAPRAQHPPSSEAVDAPEIAAIGDLLRKSGEK
jgi:hypothetical protein